MLEIEGAPCTCRVHIFGTGASGECTLFQGNYMYMYILYKLGQCPRKVSPGAQVLSFQHLVCAQNLYLILNISDV